jgi:hypothetical protein
MVFFGKRKAAGLGEDVGFVQGAGRADGPAPAVEVGVVEKFHYVGRDQPDGVAADHPVPIVTFGASVAVAGRAEDFQRFTLKIPVGRRGGVVFLDLPVADG